MRPKYAFRFAVPSPDRLGFRSDCFDFHAEAQLHIVRLAGVDLQGLILAVSTRPQRVNGPGPAAASGVSSEKTQSKYFSASLHGAFSFHKVSMARLASTTLGLTCKV